MVKHHNIKMPPSAGGLWAIVPVKHLDHAKSRLDLPDVRRELVLAMADATIATLNGWDKLSGVICVTSDPLVRRAAVKNRAVVLDDPGQGLNAAYSAGISHARELGAQHLMLVPADFIRLCTDELDDCWKSNIEHARDGRMVGAVRSASGGGTNALLMPAEHSFMPQFGRDSFALHASQTPDKFVELDAPSLAYDIDRTEDIDAAMALGMPAPQVMQVLDNYSDRATRDDPSQDAARLASRALALRDQGHGNLVTYSPKVFLPLTELCRNVCHYCTFAKSPKRIVAPYMNIERVLETARKGVAAGCHEALFTLGDRPEDRFPQARNWLEENGYTSTVDYLFHAAKTVREETGLLPHINAGCLTAEELALLRPVSASMGLMLESASERLCEKGQVHFGSPDKDPAVRLAVIEEAGRQHIPFTSGILIGIGETRQERIEALEKLAQLHRKYGHIQEIIIQNFLPKPDTKMHDVEPAPLAELVWTIRKARTIFGPKMSIQAPPNLNAGHLSELIDAGINDWGGVSPVTLDFVNPEAPWPEIQALRDATAMAGKVLAPRLTIYPEYIADAERWIAQEMRAPILELANGENLAREDNWRAGLSHDCGGAQFDEANAKLSPVIGELLSRIQSEGSDILGVDEIATLFSARGGDFLAINALADSLREDACGDAATYVINRNINYTNVCTYKCSFCAFSKGTRKHEGAEKPYLLDLAEIAHRTLEAREMGAREVCLQGGIHPQFTGETYLSIVRAVKSAVPDMHVHAFSPLEVAHGAETLGLKLDEYFALLRREGLGSLPGTAAEILHDPVRRVICPDKLTTQHWLSVIEAAHDAGLKTTATIMFGHIDDYSDWALHLLRIRNLQQRTGGFTEFVPLPFVAQEAPIYKRGQARPGATFREAILMHAIGRIVLHPHIRNVQASWVKLGHSGMKMALQSGANDMGGTLINESITRAAGAKHGQMMGATEFAALARELGRTPLRRSTTYDIVEEPLQSALELTA